MSLTLDNGEAAECVFTNTLCQPGTYDDTSACVPTDPGYYTNAPGAVAPIACFRGTYQPNSGQSSCLLADAGYYVDSIAATSQTACPAGTTSPAGSDSIDDCVATPATLTIAKATDPAGGTGFPFTLDPGAVTYAGQWGGSGVAQGQFNGPFGIASDAAGNVYVADTFDYRVQKFDANGNFLRAWGKDVKVGGVTGYEVCLAADTCKAGVNGSGDGEFNLPHGIVVDAAGNVYVADTYNSRIQKFDSDGNYLGQWGSGGAVAGQFNRPMGLAVDGAGNLYVAEVVNNRVQKFSGAGTFLAAWGYNVVVGGGINFEICTPADTCQAGSSSTGNGGFTNPYGGAVFGATVYVADTFNHRVQTFDLNGGYVNTWGSEGSGNGLFSRPYSITADAAGNLYVAEGANNRIQKFDGSGAYLGQWGSLGAANGQFDLPTGVATSGASVYVIEYNNDRVQRFAPTGATLDDGQSFTFSDLEPDTYRVSELVPAVWALTGVTCDVGCPTTSGNAVRVTLAAGDAVTCTFSNGESTAPDTTPPDTTISDGPSGATSSTDATFTFESSEPGSTFQCQLDGGGLEQCDDGDATYSGLADGAHTFTVVATDAAGNAGPPPATRTWTVDTTPPDTTNANGPSGYVPVNDLQFEFSGADDGSGVASFECRLDSGAWSACASPYSANDLPEGNRAFAVRAIDAAGNVDPTPDVRLFIVDTVVPNTSLDSHPAEFTSSNTVQFTFSSDDPTAEFRCLLNGSGLTTCASPHGYGGLAEGSYRFTVWAVDPAGNQDATPEEFNFTVDSTPPLVTFSDTTPTFAFGAADGDLGSGVPFDAFECRLDGGAWAACASPVTLDPLSDGQHTFEVRATDRAGNRSDPAGYTWTIDTTTPDTTPPDTTITNKPSNPSSNNSASFSFSSTEPGSTFECQLDSGGFSACASPQPYAGLSDGSHTFQVRATDAAGNTDPTPEAKKFASGGAQSRSFLLWVMKRAPFTEKRKSSGVSRRQHR